MNPRERKLLMAIGALAALGFAVKVVFPKWIAPMFDYDKRVEALRDHYDKRKPALDRLDQAMRKYGEFVARTGGTNETEVTDEFGRTLNDQLLLAKLSDLRVTPKEPSVDKKTGLVTLNYAFQGQGSLMDAVSFMKGYYEIPYITRFRDIRISPIKGKAGAPSEQVKLTGSIDVLVPSRPDDPVSLDPDAPPPPINRIGKESYALIWEKDFINPPRKPESPKVEVVENIPKDDPEDILPPPPPPQSAVRDPQGAQQMVRMCIQTPAEEVLVVNTASKQRQFITKGQDIDGGKLLMVHPLGAVVRRMEAGKDYDFLYPIGESYLDSVRIDQAQEYPELRAYARYTLKEERKKRKAAEEAEGAAAREAAEREAAERNEAEHNRALLAQGLVLPPHVVGPPGELAGHSGADPMLGFSAAPEMSGPFMGPPDFLAPEVPVPVPPPEEVMQPEPDPAERTRRALSARRESVGPPAELAGPSPVSEQKPPARKPPPRRSRVRRPGGAE